MSFKLIDAERGDLSVAVACAALNVSTSGYYAWRHRPASHRQRRDMVLLAHIKAEFAESNETYGSPRMHAELKERQEESGSPIGRIGRPHAEGMSST